MFLLLIFLYAGLAVLFFTVLVWWSSRMIGRFAGQAVHGMMVSTEFIVNTGKVPPEWIKKYYKIINRIETYGNSGADKLKIKLYNKYINQLYKLIRYFEGSSIVEDEESRSVLLEDLGRIYQKWRQSDFDGITIDQNS